MLSSSSPKITLWVWFHSTTETHSSFEMQVKFTVCTVSSFKDNAFLGVNINILNSLSASVRLFENITNRSTIQKMILVCAIILQKQQSNYIYLRLLYMKNKIQYNSLTQELEHIKDSNVCLFIFLI